MQIKDIENALNEANLEPYGLNSILSFISGNVGIAKNGNLKLSIELPKEALKGESIPFGMDDFKIKPLLLFCKSKTNREDQQ